MNRNDRYPRRGNYPRMNQIRTAAAEPQNAESYCICDSQPISYAMAYVKKQSFGELYSPSEGLSRGTIFRELDLPYCSGNGGRR